MKKIEKPKYHRHKHYTLGCKKCAQIMNWIGQKLHEDQQEEWRNKFTN